MHTAFVNIALAFIEGFSLIISPCILPILPIVLSGSLTGRKSRPIGIIVGFVVAFTFVTFFTRAILLFTHIPPNTLRDIALIILVLLGIIMLSDTLTEKCSLLTERFSRTGSRLQAVQQNEGGFSSGFIFGLLIGVIWTPCAGPIIAAVIVQVVVQKTTAASFLTVIAFAIGAGAPMLLIALLGREVLGGFNFFRKHAIGLRKGLGALIILTVGYLYYADNLVFNGAATKSSGRSATTLIDGLTFPYKAPAISGIQAWINSPALSIDELKGHVVLIDFWTYSCINCLRTLPYIKSLYEQYHDQGLDVIGVHSPEFAFERDENNVKDAVTRLGITYPVALDNHFVTWQNYHNEFWPAQYLINKNGYVVYQHFGEGDDDVIENNIRYLLDAPSKRANKTPSATKATIATPAPVKTILALYNQTPETYLGYARADSFYKMKMLVKSQANAYTYPPTLGRNQWALQGNWLVESDKITALSPGASIKIHFYAGQVYAVMGNSGIPVMVTVSLNGKPVSFGKGRDVSDVSTVMVNQNRLFALIASAPQDGILELTADAAGLRLYTFTFGSE